MFCFVMALKSRKLSRDWERVCRLCNSSVRSACNQTCPDFRMIVVCHETPTLDDAFDARVEIINVDFPPPELDPRRTMQDKWAKLAVGMVRAGEHRPDYVMIMDADDLVSNRLVDYAHAHPGENGWMFHQGYEWKFGDSWIRCATPFVDCGTNAIVGGHLIRFPTDTNAQSIADCVVLRWGHTAIAEQLAKAGTPLKALPFRGAVNVKGHGDNDLTFFNTSRSVSRIRKSLSFIRPGKWKTLAQLRPCTAALRQEFSIV